MSDINIFMDSSALISGIISSAGAARAILLLAESGQITITISEQVIVETERSIARKLPGALAEVRQAILISKAQIVRDPTPEEVNNNLHLISYAPDVPIVVAAQKAGVDFLATLDLKHFINDPNVAKLSGLRIGTPGDALSWLRGQFSTGQLER
jgi:predicted nucleic acid-binding protein